MECLDHWFFELKHRVTLITLITIVSYLLGIVFWKNPKISLRLKRRVGFKTNYPQLILFQSRVLTNDVFVRWCLFFTNIISIVILYCFYSSFFFSFQDLVKNMLSWKPFIPLASLNFNAYMVNTILPVADTASRRTPDHFDIRNFVSVH